MVTLKSGLGVTQGH